MREAILPLFALALTLAAGACSPSSADGPSESSVIAGAKPSICAFPERSHTRPIADHYITFSNPAEREVYLAAFLPTMRLRRSADEAAVPDVQKVVDELYPSIRAELASEIAGIDQPPFVVLLDDKLPNAFAAGDTREGTVRAPWVLFVNEGLLALKPAAHELRGVMAHELGHLVAKHQFPDAPTRVRRHYSVTGRDEASVVIALEEDDAEVRKFADAFEGLVAYGGAFDVPSLRGFTVRFSGVTKPIRYHTMFEMLGRLPTPQCSAHAATYGALQETLRAHLSKFDHQIRVPADIAPTVDEAERLAHACAASMPVTLTELAVEFELAVSPARRDELTAAATQGNAALRSAVLDADEIAIDDGEGDVVSKLLALGTRKRQRLAELVEHAPTPPATMRRYAEEVEADQIAVRVLLHAGIDPTGGAAFLLRSLDDDGRAKCDAALAAGTVPPFGGFAFLHPATCWRVFQAKRFASTLAVECPGARDQAPDFDP